MDWELVITRNRGLLLRIVAMLFSVAGLDDREVPGPDPRIATLPRATRNYIMRILRPAESAVRRLIVIAAREVKAPTLSPRGRESRFPHLRGHRPGKCLEKASEGAGMAKIPPFPLVDPLKHFDFGPPKRHATTQPRIRSLSDDWSVPVYMRRPDPSRKPEPMPDDPVDATGLCRRLRSLKNALDDLPGQARRFARWKARPKRVGQRNFPRRPGYPPGYRKRHQHEIDEILKDLDLLAQYALNLDTS